MDFSDCLGNCSNQGKCFKGSQKFVCLCDAFFDGATCQRDLKPCSSNPCLNNALCIEDLIKFSYQCNCSDQFEGTNCQTKKDICFNETCSFNGYCIDDNDFPKCKCFYQYSGEKCQIESSDIKFRKFVVTTSTVIVILFLIIFFFLIILIDLSEFFCKTNIKKRVLKPEKKPFKKFNYVP